MLVPLSDAKVWSSTPCTEGQRLTGIVISFAAQLHVIPTHQWLCTGLLRLPAWTCATSRSAAASPCGVQLPDAAPVGLCPSSADKPTQLACPAFEECLPTSGRKPSFCALQTAAKATHLGLHHPPDRNGKAIMDKFSTPDLDEALNVYRIACDEARAAVRKQLRQLATGLQAGAVLHQPVFKCASWSDCSHVRPHMSRVRSLLAFSVSKCAPAAMSAPPLIVHLRPKCYMAIVAIGQQVLP